MTLLPEPSDRWGGLLGRIMGVTPTGPAPAADAAIRSNGAPFGAPAAPDGLVPASADGLGRPTYSAADREAAMAGLLNAGLATWAAAQQRDRYGRTPGLGEIFYTGLAAGQKAAQGAQAYSWEQQDAQLKRQAAARALQQQEALQRIFLGLASGQIGGGIVPVAAPPSLAAPAAGLPATPPPPLELSPELVAMPEELRPMFLDATREAGLTPDQSRLFARMLGQESGYRHLDPKTGQVLTSSAGARGLAQVLPGTFGELQQRYGIEGGIDDPRANLVAGANYFREQIDEFGDLGTAVTAYVAGPQNVRDNTIGPRSAEYRRLVMQGFQPGLDTVPETAPATAAAPGPVAGGGLEFMPQLSQGELLMLAALAGESPADALKTYFELIKTMRTEGTPAYRTLSAAEAQQYGLPGDRLWQIGTRGAQAGRIVQAGQEGASTNVQVSLERGLTNYDIGRLTEMRKTVDTEAEILPTLQAMQSSLLSGTATGALQPLRMTVNSFLADAGIPGFGRDKDLGQQEFLQAMADYIVPRMRPVGSGASSDRDVGMFQRAAGGLSKSADANLLLVGGYLQARQRRAAEVEAMETYLRRNGSLEGYDNWARNNLPPVFPRWKTEEDLAGLPAGTVVIYDGPSGELRDGTKLRSNQFFVIRADGSLGG